MVGGFIANDHTRPFFFTVGFNAGRFKKKKRIYVMTIGRTWPYRLIEEEYAYSCIGKYFRGVPRKPKKKSKKRSTTQTTWKLWGTNFIKELDQGKALSDYQKERDQSIFEYLIQTEDEWIEFVSGIPRWTTLRDMTVKSAIRKYLKEA